MNGLTFVSVSLGILTTAAAVASPSRPDSWMPFTDKRIVSASGSHYAIIKAAGAFSPGPFSLHERRKGVPPIEPGDRKEADEADRVLAKGTLPQLPMDAMVSEKPLGIVLFDKYASVGYGKTLTFLDGQGKPRWAVDLKALFGGPPKGSTHTTSSLWWSSNWGIDDGRSSAWVVTNAHEFREVSLRDGSISTPDLTAIVRWCCVGETERRTDTLNALLATHPKIPPVHGPRLAEVADRKSEALGLRLRAAIGAHRCGVHANSWLQLFHKALRSEDAELKGFAGTHLLEFEPEEGLRVLREALHNSGEFLHHRAFVVTFIGGREDWYANAMRGLGERGEQLLRDIVADENADMTARVNAEAIRSILGAKDLPEAALEICRFGTESFANKTLNILIDREPEGLEAALIDLLRKSSGDDGRLALYFREHPTRDAISALEAAITRVPESKRVRKNTDWRWMQEALEACKK